VRLERVEDADMATHATVAEGSPVRSLADLYERTAPAAIRFAYVVSGDREMAQDLVQDAFARVAGRFHHLRKPDAFDAYLRRTIVNLFTSHLRHRRVERAYREIRRPDPPPDHTIEDVAERDRMWGALATLPRRQRAAVVLRFYEDLSEREVADLLGCSTSAVNSLVEHGMAALRELMGSEES
jgi:RNA polymerase sigma-70 factor (sigma-E family)